MLTSHPNNLQMLVSPHQNAEAFRFAKRKPLKNKLASRGPSVAQ